LVNEHLLGLVPWSLGLDPGRRIYLTEQAVLTEDHGMVSVHRYPSGPSIRVLRELTDGPKTNAALLGSVWNLRTYSPSRHDPTLHTAVARLRAALAPRAEWVVTTRHGYQLAPDVELVVVGDELDVHAPDRIEAADAGMTAVSDRESHILEIIGRRRVASSTELAQDLRVSDATALRSLRALVGDRKIHRTGRGKSTRYSLFPEALPAEGERS
jgi:DNA-binding winged helix-turn-helix (wHTH) protein